MDRPAALFKESPPSRAPLHGSFAPFVYFPSRWQGNALDSTANGGIMAKFTGGCLCGAIRYEADGEPVTAGACHCRDCQYVSGGGPAHVLVMAAGDVKMTKGEPRIYFSLSEAGHTVGRSFCEDCGTPIFAQNAARPGFLSIKAGTLDDPSLYRPRGHIWVKSAQPWHHIDPALPTIKGDPV